MKIVDMHMHSTYSDGELKVSELLERARIAGVSELAITDHDTIINMKNYEQLANKHNVRIVPGIELNVDYPNMHILGYGIIDIDYIENEITEMKKRNVPVCIKTIELLKREGVDISYDEVMANVKPGALITKRNIARLLVKKGYAATNLEVYEKLMGKGCKAYVPIEKLNYLAALRLITKCGGIPVLAHPISIGRDVDFDKLIPPMKENGLVGIESMTARHTEEERKYYSSVAKKFNLIETAGSDFHRDSDGIPIGMHVEDTFLDKFYVAINEVHKNV